jgi:hypothetical protein
MFGFAYIGTSSALHLRFTGVCRVCIACCKLEMCCTSALAAFSCFLLVAWCMCTVDGRPHAREHSALAAGLYHVISVFCTIDGWPCENQRMTSSTPVCTAVLLHVQSITDTSRSFLTPGRASLLTCWSGAVQLHQLVIAAFAPHAQCHAADSHLATWVL